MARRRVERPEAGIWDVFRHDTPANSQKNFLPQIQDRPSRQGTYDRVETPKQKLEEPSIEMRGRMRELEIQLMDVRAGVERRLSSVSQEFPSRLHKELQFIQERDSQLWRDNNSKIVLMQESLKTLQESTKSSFDRLFIELGTLRRRTDQIELKESSNERQLEHISSLPKAIAYEPSPDFSEVNHTVQTLRDALQDERQRREEAQRESARQMKEMYDLLLNNEREMARRFQQYRDEIVDSQSQIKQQSMEVEQARQERLKNDQDYLKGVFTSLQRRVDEQVDLRTQSEKEYKNWTDSKLSKIQEFIRTDERNLAERERTVVTMMQEGLGALYEIINKLKQAQSVNLSKVQTVMNENIRDITSAIATIKDNLYARVESLEMTVQEEMRIRTENQTSIQASFNSVAETIERQNTNIENAIASSENRVKQQIYNMQQETMRKDEEFKTWKQDLSNSLTSNLEELAGTIEEHEHKTNKQVTELKDVDDELKRKIVLLAENIHSDLEQLKNTVAYQDELLEQKVNFIMNKSGDQYNKEIHETRAKLEREIAMTESKSASNLAAKIDNLYKALIEEMKKFAVRESSERERALGLLEAGFRVGLENLYKEVNTDIKPGLGNNFKRYEQLENDMEQLRKEMSSIQNSNASNANVQTLTEETVSKAITELLKDMELVIQTEREVMLKEIERVKSEIGQTISNIQLANAESVANLQDKLSEQVNTSTDKVKKEGDYQMDILNAKLQEVTFGIQDNINKSIEAVKALCKALITQEASQRNNSEEDIIRNMNARMSSLEDLMKYNSGKTTENAKAEVQEIMGKEEKHRDQFEDRIEQKVAKMISDEVDQKVGDLEVKSKQMLVKVNSGIEEVQAQITQTEEGLTKSIQDLVLIQDSFNNQIDELKQMHEGLKQKVGGIEGTNNDREPSLPPPQSNGDARDLNDKLSQVSKATEQQNGRLEAQQAKVNLHQTQIDLFRTEIDQHDTKLEDMEEKVKSMENRIIRLEQR